MRIARWTVTGARLLAGGVAAAAVVAVVAAAVIAPWPDVQRTPVSVVATPAAGIVSAGCTGPLLAAGRNSRDAAQLDVAAVPTVVGEGAAHAIPSPVAGEAVVFTGAGGVVAGAQSATVSADDMVGFAASVCPVPQFVSWLTAGATTTGSADLVILTNPGDVPASVDLAVFGTDGPVSAPGSTGIVLPARAQHIVALSGLIVGERAPVVRVESSGAPIVAALQSSRTQTLDPVGVDVFTGAADAAAVQVIPGIVVPETPAEGSAALDVRLLAPADDTPVTVTVTAMGTTTTAGGGGMTADVALTAGATVEASFPRLAAGTYNVTVTAEAPVVAAARTGSAAPRDIAWYAAAPLVAAPTVLAVAPGPGTRLVVADAGPGGGAGEVGDAGALSGSADAADDAGGGGDAGGGDGGGSETASDTAADPIEVTLVPSDGGPTRTLTVASGSSGAVTLPGAGVWRVEVSRPVHATVTYAGEGVLASFPVQAAPDAAAALRVYP